MKISLVILTLNEIEGVREIIPKVNFGEVDEVFVVDGGSTDGTREFFEHIPTSRDSLCTNLQNPYKNYKNVEFPTCEKGIRVLPQKSKGRGEAFRMAMENVTSDAVIFFSPDGNENPADFPKFRKFLEEGYDIVIGSRMMKGAVNEEDISWWRPRKWANQVFTLLVNLIWNPKFLIGKSSYITDTINGYRAITKEAWNKIHPDDSGFIIEFQMSIRALKLGLKTKEFPTIEGQRIGGKSGSESFSTGIKFLKLLLREMRVGKRF